MMIVLQTDEGVDLVRVHVLVDSYVTSPIVLANVMYEDHQGAQAALAVKLMPWSDLEEIAAWVRSCGDEFVGIADGILEGRRVPVKPAGSRASDGPPTEQRCDNPACGESGLCEDCQRRGAR